MLQLSGRPGTLNLRFEAHFWGAQRLNPDGRIMTRNTFYTALEDILEMPHGSLKDSDSRDTIATWSSLADVQILAVIASEFGIEPEAELMEAETVGDLIQALEARSVFPF